MWRNLPDVGCRSSPDTVSECPDYGVLWCAILTPSESSKEHENSLSHTKEIAEYCKILNWSIIYCNSSKQEKINFHSLSHDEHAVKRVPTSLPDK